MNSLTRAVLLAACLALATSAHGSLAPGDLRLEHPPGLRATSAGLLVRWRPVAGASSYALYWTTEPGISLEGAQRVTCDRPHAVLEQLPEGTTLYVRVAAVDGAEEGPATMPKAVEIPKRGKEKYFPAWVIIPPQEVSLFEYDDARSSSANGERLRHSMQSLQPGETLVVGPGTYTIDSKFELSLRGTPGAPIHIVAARGPRPVLRRSNARQNTINLGSADGRLACRYLSLRGFEITGGSIALRLNRCDNVWIDNCHIHDCSANAIAANTHRTDRIHYTRNIVHSTGGEGEGFYIGGNHGNPIASRCVIALNRVYDTGGTQGDGIELKQGSWGNWIAENIVHDTPYPCILVYGTGGRPRNVIERNICWNSRNNVMQVQGEALVRNNLLISGLQGFSSHDHQGATKDLIVIHNTIINSGAGARFESWNDRPGMVFANNAVYSKNGHALHFASGSEGVKVAGNVVFGSVSGVAEGFKIGAGLADFKQMRWDAKERDATPAPGSVLDGGGRSGYADIEDLAGRVRSARPVDAGALEGP